MLSKRPDTRLQKMQSIYSNTQRKGKNDTGNYTSIRRLLGNEVYLRAFFMDKVSISGGLDKEQFL